MSPKPSKFSYFPIVTPSRTFASKEYYKKKRKQREPDPFVVLGVVEFTPYSQVKKTFLKIAMAHHPDTTSAETEEEKQEHRDIFMQARRAFEKLVEGPDGVAILGKDADRVWEESEMDAWFEQETGHHMPYMDAKTMKEVAEMTDKMGAAEMGGLDRDGGMWTLARMVSQTVKSGGDAGSILALEAGEVRSREIDGELRRKRRR